MPEINTVKKAKTFSAKPDVPNMFNKIIGMYVVMGP